MSKQDKASIHKRVREQHLSEVSEDYLEAIYELLNQNNQVKVSDLQEVFGVSHVTVIKKLQRLQDQGYLEGTKSKQIALTEIGEEIATEAIKKHQLLKRFLMQLGVSEKQADADAEGAEHHLSQETYEAISKFLNDDSPA